MGFFTVLAGVLTAVFMAAAEKGNREPGDYRGWGRPDSLREPRKSDPRCRRPGRVAR
jgi:hypothetical protein